MIRAIGESAGTVWNYLREHSDTQVEKLAKELKMKQSLVLMAIGWLAREGKLDFKEDKKKTKLSLAAK